MPFISVIIPTYNRAQLTLEAVQSVLQQTYGDFEVIVIDDGSTDDTELVINGIHDPRIRYLKRENGGAAAASNSGLAVATGEWIAFLDSDDLFLPQKFDQQRRAVKNEPEVGVIYGRYYGTTDRDDKKKLVGRCFSATPLADLLMGPIFHWSTALMKRSLLQKIGFFDLSFWVGEDWELTLRMALTGCKFLCVPHPLAIVRIQPVSLSRDIHKYEACGRGVLDKTFAHPDFPAELYPLRPRAYASHLLRAAASAYLSNQPERGRQPLERAIDMDPSLANENRDFLITRLFNYIQGLSLEDPEKTLKKMASHLPQEPSLAHALRQELKGTYHLNQAFRARQENERAASCRHAIKAITSNPANLRNRGLVSLLVRSILGGSFFHTETEFL